LLTFYQTDNSDKINISLILAHPDQKESVIAQFIQEL